MKRLLLALFLVAGILLTYQSKAQVYVGAKIGIGIPHPRHFLAPPVVTLPVPTPYPYYGGAPVIYPPVYRNVNPYYYRERHWRHWRRCY
ncbi:MAG: hypothetical protein ACHQEM_08205 [Chitinophagales bacterium]